MFYYVASSRGHARSRLLIRLSGIKLYFLSCGCLVFFSLFSQPKSETHIFDNGVSYLRYVLDPLSDIILTRIPMQTESNSPQVSDEYKLLIDRRTETLYDAVMYFVDESTYITNPKTGEKEPRMSRDSIYMQIGRIQRDFSLDKGGNPELTREQMAELMRKLATKNNSIQMRVSAVIDCLLKSRMHKAQIILVVKKLVEPRGMPRRK